MTPRESDHASIAVMYLCTSREGDGRRTQRPCAPCGDACVLTRAARHARTLGAVNIEVLDGRSFFVSEMFERSHAMVERENLHQSTTSTSTPEASTGRLGSSALMRLGRRGRRGRWHTTSIVVCARSSIARRARRSSRRSLERFARAWRRGRPRRGIAVGRFRVTKAARGRRTVDA